MLTDSLERTGLAIDGVTCLKQIVPNNYSLFMYCFMVSIEIKSDQQKVSNLVEQIHSKTFIKWCNVAK